MNRKVCISIVNTMVLLSHIISASSHKVAVIGAGIGGTASAYFLKDHLGDHVKIDIYEPKTVGGRLATSLIAGRNYENGGSIIHTRNEYMNKFVKEFGLKKRTSCSFKLGLYDGNSLFYSDTNWQLINMVKLFYRYGLDLYSVRKLNDAMLQQFSKIYKLQDTQHAYRSAEEMLRAMLPDFKSVISESISNYLKNAGLHDKIIDELITAITRANYGQMTDIHGFVGSVGMAGAGDDLWAVEDGNKRVPEELLHHSGANLMSRSVDKVTLIEGNKFVVSSKVDRESNEIPQDNQYDAVIIATPLTEDHNPPKLLNFPASFNFSGRYQRVVCTMVYGKLNHEYFGTSDTFINEILTTNGSLFFNSVGEQSPVDTKEKDCKPEKEQVFKIFSPELLTEAQLNKLFTKRKHVDVTDWLAYPHYESSATLGQFELIPGLYYNNAIEMAASAMEMSLISAKNAALLVTQYLGHKIDDPQGSLKSEL